MDVGTDVSGELTASIFRAVYKNAISLLTFRTAYWLHLQGRLKECYCDGDVSGEITASHLQGSLR